MIDEFNREALEVEVDTSLPAERGPEPSIMPLHGKGFQKRSAWITALSSSQKKMSLWAEKNQVELKFIQPGKPTQNPFAERFNGTFRLEFLSPNLFDDIDQVCEAAFEWKLEYNEQRPHQALNGLTPELVLQNHRKQQSLLISGTNSGGEDTRIATVVLSLIRDQKI